MPLVTIDTVDSWERTANGVVFDCTLVRHGETETRRRGSLSDPLDRTVPVELTFLRADVFRFETRASPERGPTGRLDLDTDRLREASPVEIDVERRADHLVVRTADLAVTVGTDPWRFRVADRDGRTLFEERREDPGDKNGFAVAPLGFEEAERSEWVYATDRAGIGFEIHPDERFYGLGERFTGVDARGTTADVHVSQPHTTDNERTYKGVPFLLSSRGYGLLVDTTRRTEVGLGAGAGSAQGGEIRVDGTGFSFLFFHGPDPADVLRNYTAAAGRPSRPPAWSFGLWTSRYSYEDRAAVERVTDRFRSEEIPCDGVHLDVSWMRDGHESDLVWDTDAFPAPESLVDDLAARDFRLMVIEEPYLTADSEAFRTAAEAGYLVEDGTGQPYVLDRLVISDRRGGIVDFTDPDAVRWWQDRHRELLEMGVDGFWTDFGEYLPDDAVLADGHTGEQARNVFPHLYQRAVDAVCREERGPETLLWGRSGWAGTQRFPVHWGGDSEATFASMAATLRGGLNLAASGYGFWSHDIGGFDGTPSPELYVRWAQFGLLSSHARLHGKTPREPWEFGDEALAAFRTAVRLRYSLLPYLYAQATVTSETGLPMMRPLFVEYPDDPAAHGTESQYLLGPDLLVAPVLAPGGEVTVYLPEGEWVDHWSGERYEGGRTLERTVPLDEVPLFVRAGSVVPRCPPARSVPALALDAPRLEARLADGYAEGRVLDEDRDGLVSVRVRRRGDAVELLTDGTVRWRAVRVTGVAEAPERVSMTDATGETTELSPDRWSYEDDTLLVQAENRP